MIIPTLTPIRARRTSNSHILSTQNAPAPESTYKASPVSARVRVFINRQSQGKTRFVRMINSDGRLTISWISSGLRPSKWALMTPSAGAMAAPAMTVRRLMERMVYSNLFFMIKNV